VEQAEHFLYLFHFSFLPEPTSPRLQWVFLAPDLATRAKLDKRHCSHVTLASWVRDWAHRRWQLCRDQLGPYLPHLTGSTGLSIAVDWPTLWSLTTATDMQTKSKAKERSMPTRADAPARWFVGKMIQPRDRLAYRSWRWTWSLAQSCEITMGQAYCLFIRWASCTTHQSCASFCSFSTDPTKSLLQIKPWYIPRWNIEASFQEARAYVGLETKWQWSVPTIARTTPSLLGLFCSVVLIAQTLHQDHLSTHQPFRHAKAEPTFVEALVDVHRYFEALQNTPTTPPTMGSFYYSTVLLDIIIKVACYPVW